MSKVDTPKTTSSPAADDPTNTMTPPPAADAGSTQEPSGVGPLPETTAPAPIRFRVSFQFGLNLRAAPGYESAILKVLPCGTEVDSNAVVLVGDTLWVNAEGGWVDASYLTEV